MGYLDELRSYNSAEKRADDALTKPTQPSSVGCVSSSVGHFSKNPTRLIATWRAGVERLHRNKPLHGIEPRRWRTLWGDAHWFLDHFGDRSARDGWDGLELFGLTPGRPGFGGLVERLNGSRSLVMGDWHANWRSIARTPMSFGRGGLTGATGLVMLWETAQ